MKRKFSLIIAAAVGITLFAGCSSNIIDSITGKNEELPGATMPPTQPGTESMTEESNEPETEETIEETTEKKEKIEMPLSEWEQERDTGSIMEIADIEWAMETAPNFYVTTPEQLAGVVYYVNAWANGEKVYIVLGDDIDLEGLSWVPMGWSNGVSHAFSGVIDGQEHEIRNMYIDCQLEPQTGFIGYGVDTKVDNIFFVNAEVHGGTRTAIVAGEIYMSSVWTNIGAQGSISASITDCGAIIGRNTGTSLRTCYPDVTLNGEPFPYLTYDDKLYADSNRSEIFTITMDGNYTVSRNAFEGFVDLHWHIQRDGTDIAFNDADNEGAHNYSELIAGNPGVYRIWLDSYYNNTHMRVSNIIEFAINEDGEYTTVSHEESTSESNTENESEQG